MGTMPRRHVVVALTFLGVIVAFTDRVNISVSVLTMRTHFNWTQTDVGLVLSCFFFGYMSCLFLGGLLAARYGGKRVAGFSVLIWSICTLITPLAAATLPTLIAARLGLGMSEAGLFPACYDLFARWLPAEERGFAVGRFLSGVPIGTLVGLSASGWLVARHGWASPFYVFGLLGLLWMLVWAWQIARGPHEDPRIGAQELAMFRPVDSAVVPEQAMPLRRLIWRLPVLAVIAGQFAISWTQNMLLSWLPSYFRDVQGVSIGNSGLISAAPWVAMLLALNVCGFLSDRMVGLGVALTRVRKVFLVSGLAGSALCLLSIGTVHTPFEASCLLSGALAALGCASCGSIPGNIDIAPRNSGIMVGFTNTIAQLPALIGVAVTGWLIDQTGTYSAAFILAAFFCGVGSLLFIWFFEAETVADCY